MASKLPNSGRGAKGGRHDTPQAQPAEAPAVPTLPELPEPEPAVSDPWLAALERDTDRALRAMADGDPGQAVQWLALAVRSMAAHLPAVRQVADEIRCRRLAVVDADGKPRMILTSEGGELLQAFQADGEQVAHLHVPERDWKAGPHLQIGSDRGISATLSGGAVDGGLEVAQEHEVVIAAGTSTMTSPSLRLLNHNDAAFRVEFEDGPTLTMHDDKKHASVKATCEAGDATIGVYREGVGAQMDVTDKDETTVSLWAKGSRHELRAEAGNPATSSGRSNRPR